MNVIFCEWMSTVSAMSWSHLKVICNIIMTSTSINLFRKLKTFEILGHISSWEHDSLQFISIILLHNLETVYFRVVHVCFCKLTLFYLGLIFLWRPVHRNTTTPSLVLLRQQPFLSQQWKLKNKFNNCIQIHTMYLNWAFII